MAGALSDKLSIGSVAISSAVVQHDMDTSALGDPLGLISGVWRSGPKVSSIRTLP